MKLTSLLIFGLLTINGYAQDCTSELHFHPNGEKASGIATDGNQFWVSESTINFSANELNAVSYTHLTLPTTPYV